jgi:hypothetical protein
MIIRRSVIPLLTVALAAALLGAGPAAAATPCWRAVINDWYKDGHVDGHYPIHCYSEAIANLPEDSKQYSTAPEDIRRDMLLAMRGDQPSGPNGPGSSPSPAPTSGSGGSASGPSGSDNTGGTGNSSSTSSSTAAPNTGFGGPPIEETAAASPKQDSGFIGGVLNTFGPKNASSVPLPLIVLAAVALLLLAAGAASFLARRIQARRIPPPRP